jgi:hypothetical protein
MTIAHDESAGMTLATTWRLDLECITVARFAHLVVERALEHIAESSWATERMTLEGLFDRALTTLRDHSERAAVLALGDVAGGGCLAHVSLSHGSAHVRLAARNIDSLAAGREWLRERFPVTKPQERQAIPVSFWSLGQGGGRSSVRMIDVPRWEEIVPNYPARVARQLEPLMHDRSLFDTAGRLVLWHGPPGTGKTWALRALGWEWRSWCRLHYVTDPETFFGSSPRYMLDVLLDEGEDDEWRLLVLEDTGELLAADAKERTGQGLSRLLNVVDGLIGQGLRVIVLVTTNEPLGALHEAVARPGRCAAQIEFAPFTLEEAREWLERSGGDAEPRAGTLASLYARAAGLEVRERRPVGFAR